MRIISFYTLKAKIKILDSLKIAMQGTKSHSPSTTA